MTINPMTMAANIWRYRFHSLNESDHNDSLDGNEFFVQYIGCTAINEDYEMASDTQIEDFFNCVASKYQENNDRLLFKMLVNRNGVMICDGEGNIQYTFEASNICYFTTTNSWGYSKYLVIVARTRQEQSLKGHVLLCKNKSNVKRICQTFTKMFKMAGPVTIDTDDEKVCTKAGEAKTRNQAKDLKAGFPVRDLNMNENPNPFNDHPEKLLDDGFTELAKSRSVSQ